MIKEGMTHDLELEAAEAAPAPGPSDSQGRQPDVGSGPRWLVRPIGLALIGSALEQAGLEQLDLRVEPTVHRCRSGPVSGAGPPQPLHRPGDRSDNTWSAPPDVVRPVRWNCRHLRSIRWDNHGAEAGGRCGVCLDRGRRRVARTGRWSAGREAMVVARPGAGRRQTRGPRHRQPKATARRPSTWRSEFERAGLKPAGTDGYFQPVRLSPARSTRHIRA